MRMGALHVSCRLDEVDCQRCEGGGRSSDLELRYCRGWWRQVSGAMLAKVSSGGGGVCRRAPQPGVNRAYAEVQGRGAMAGGGPPPGLGGLAGFDTSDSDLSHHPDYPSLPAAVPLTYTLVMRACLSQDPAERPSFGHLVSMLEDLKTEVESGSYVDSTGGMQVGHLLHIPRPHRCLDGCCIDSGALILAFRFLRVVTA